MIPEPTIQQLAADATRAEHLIHAAKMLQKEVYNPLRWPRSYDVLALEAVIHEACSLAGSVAIELRTVAERAKRQEGSGSHVPANHPVRVLPGHARE